MGSCILFHFFSFFCFFITVFAFYWFFSFIFISFLASILGMHDIQAYTFCKNGIKGLTRSLSRDLGPYGIRVNSLNPGFVYTDMLAKTN